MNARTRTLRLAPKDLMTGDLLVEKAYRGGMVESVVTWIEPKKSNRGAAGFQITTVGGFAPGCWYAAQRRLTVKRSGPKGFGE